VYAYFVDQMKTAPGHGGKAFIYLAGGMVAGETLLLIFILKRVGMWLHSRQHGGTPHPDDEGDGEPSELANFRENSRSLWK
jgi:hypothetical protein